jgi:hypothetical protein
MTALVPVPLIGQAVNCGEIEGDNSAIDAGMPRSIGKTEDFWRCRVADVQREIISREYIIKGWDAKAVYRDL